jgi:hypothetical protein
VTLLGASMLALPGVSPCAPRQGPAAGVDAVVRSDPAAARRSPLTAADTVVLADFGNSTGDALFDDTLRQAFALELEESPFVNVLGDRQVQAALQAAGQPSGQTLTADAGRKACARTGSKAVLQGAISRQGEGYRVDVIAVDCATGVELAHARSEVPAPAGVLGALSQAASSLRAQLGEAAASVRSYHAPAGTTTAALEALKSYSLGLATQRAHGDDPSIADFRRAIQLDPQLAIADASLAAAYRNLRQPTLPGIPGLLYAWECLDADGMATMAGVMTAAGGTRVNVSSSRLWLWLRLQKRLRQRHSERRRQSFRVSLEIQVGIHVLPPSTEIDQS